MGICPDANSAEISLDRQRLFADLRVATFDGEDGTNPKSEIVQRVLGEMRQVGIGINKFAL